MSTDVTKLKTIAFMAYLLLPGWLLAFILNKSQPTIFTTFHIRQSFGIMCLSTLIFIILGLINFLVQSITASVLIVVNGILPMIILWCIGVIGVIKGTTKPVPVVGVIFQKWFRGI